MAIERLAGLEDPRLRWYRGVSDPVLLRESNRFVAEGRTVVARLVQERRWPVESLLVSPSALGALESSIGRRLEELTVFVLPLDALTALAGYNIHRGCLAIGMRQQVVDAGPLMEDAERAAWCLGLERLADPDNVGVCFRNAAAFGVDAVLLDEACVDPLYRKAIRTSMAATLRVPFARVGSWPTAIRRWRATGGTAVGLTPLASARDLTSLDPQVPSTRRALLLLGNEGHGLDAATARECDALVRIPMAPEVDSINVGSAAAIALHAFARARGTLPGSSE